MKSLKGFITMNLAALGLALGLNAATPSFTKADEPSGSCTWMTERSQIESIPLETRLHESRVRRAIEGTGTALTFYGSLYCSAGGDYDSRRSADLFSFAGTSDGSTPDRRSGVEIVDGSGNSIGTLADDVNEKDHYIHIELADVANRIADARGYPLTQEEIVDLAVANAAHNGYVLNPNSVLVLYRRADDANWSTNPQVSSDAMFGSFVYDILVNDTHAPHTTFGSGSQVANIGSVRFAHLKIEPCEDYILFEGQRVSGGLVVVPKWLYGQPAQDSGRDETSDGGIDDGGNDDSDGGIPDRGDADGGDVTPRPNPTRTACSDGIDNDGDTLVDLADPGCTIASDDSEDNQLPQPTPENGNIGVGLEGVVGYYAIDSMIGSGQGVVGARATLYSPSGIDVALSFAGGIFGGDSDTTQSQSVVPGSEVSISANNPANLTGQDISIRHVDDSDETRHDGSAYVGTLTVGSHTENGFTYRGGLLVGYNSVDSQTTGVENDPRITEGGQSIDNLGMSCENWANARGISGDTVCIPGNQVNDSSSTGYFSVGPALELGYTALPGLSLTGGFGLPINTSNGDFGYFINLGLGYSWGGSDKTDEQ